MIVTLAFRKGKPKNLLSKFIMWASGSIYDHTEIIIGTVWVGAHITRGVVATREVDTSFEWDYIRVNVDSKYNHVAVQFVDDVNANKYDFAGAIFGNLFNIPLVNIKNKYFCSELVATVMQRFNSKPVMGLDPVSISPQDLYELYEGK